MENQTPETQNSNPQVPVPNSAPVQSAPRKKSKLMYLLLAILVLLVLTIGAISSIYISKSLKPKPTPAGQGPLGGAPPSLLHKPSSTPSPSVKQVQNICITDQITPAPSPAFPVALGTTPPLKKVGPSWKTYSDSSLGFSFSYPPAWQIVTDSQGSVTLFPAGADTQGPTRIMAVTYREGVQCGDIPSDKTMPVKMSVGGLQGITYQDTSLGTPDNVVDVDLPYKNGTLHIIASIGPGVNYTDQMKEILSTFKFIDTSTPIPTTNPTDTSNWKTYNNDTLGVTFLYPPFFVSVFKQEGYDDISFGENATALPGMDLFVLSGNDATNANKELDLKLNHKNTDHYIYSDILPITTDGVTFYLYYKKWDYNAKDANGRPIIPPVGGPINYYEADTLHNGKFYGVSYSRIDDPSTTKSLQDAKNYIKTVVSTFKFTK